VAETGKGGLLAHRRGSIIVPHSVSQTAQHARFFRRSLNYQVILSKNTLTGMIFWTVLVLQFVGNFCTSKLK
jgi:hypothetical protein